MVETLKLFKKLLTAAYSEGCEDYCQAHTSRGPCSSLESSGLPRKGAQTPLIRTNAACEPAVYILGLKNCGFAGSTHDPQAKDEFHVLTGK